MKKYEAQVMIGYYQTVIVEAETSDQAREMMIEKFDLQKAEAGTYYVYDLEEVTEDEEN